MSMHTMPCLVSQFFLTFPIHQSQHLSQTCLPMHYSNYFLLSTSRTKQGLYLSINYINRVTHELPFNFLIKTHV